MGAHSYSRDLRVIAAVPCPACGAERGRLCIRIGTHGSARPDGRGGYVGRIYVCSDRRTEYQYWCARVLTRPCPECGAAAGEGCYDYRRRTDAEPQPGRVDRQDRAPHAARVGTT